MNSNLRVLNNFDNGRGKIVNEEFLEDYENIEEVRRNKKRIEMDNMYKELYYNDYFDEFYYGTDYYSFIY